MCRILVGGKRKQDHHAERNIDKGEKIYPVAFSALILTSWGLASHLFPWFCWTPLWISLIKPPFSFVHWKWVLITYNQVYIVPSLVLSFFQLQNAIMLIFKHRIFQKIPFLWTFWSRLWIIWSNTIFTVFFSCTWRHKELFSRQEAVLHETDDGTGKGSYN